MDLLQEQHKGYLFNRCICRSNSCSSDNHITDNTASNKSLSNVKKPFNISKEMKIIPYIVKSSNASNTNTNNNENNESFSMMFKENVNSRLRYSKDVDNKSVSVSALINSDDNKNSASVSVPIINRGHFYSDVFFQDTHKHYKQTIKCALQKQGHQRSAALSEDRVMCTLQQRSIDDLKTYRRLRVEDQQQQQQSRAICLLQDGNVYKIVMDVHDFVKDDIRVNILYRNQILVEGKAEPEDRTEKQIHCSLPSTGLIKIELASVAVSSDNILVIAAIIIEPNEISFSPDSPCGSIQRTLSSESYFSECVKCDDTTFEESTDCAEVENNTSLGNDKPLLIEIESIFRDNDNPFANEFSKDDRHHFENAFRYGRNESDSYYIGGNFKYHERNL